MHIAIIGSGPSAFYTCQGLLKEIDNVHIDIFERLPFPFGLVRYGVAPDHQKTKNIIKLFSKILEDEKVNFFGNINVGIDIDITLIAEMYDAVVLASGAENDKKLSVNGENISGVYGASKIVGWYNGVPANRDLNPNLNITNAVIIGNGNVALDCARLLAKNKEEFHSSDITNYSLDALTKSSIKNIYIIGRRTPLEAKFTIAELREIGILENFSPVVEYPLDQLEKIFKIPDLETKIKKNIEILIDYKKNNNTKEGKIFFKFLYSPIEIIGDKQVSSIKLCKNILNNKKLTQTNEFEEIKTGLVISAIGYNTRRINKLPLNEYKNYYLNSEGHILNNIYVTGWAADSSVGVIGSNKIAANKIAIKISSEVFTNKNKPYDKVFEFLKERNIRFISKKDWALLDDKEISDATENFVREKAVDMNVIFKYLNK